MNEKSITKSRVVYLQFSIGLLDTLGESDPTLTVNVSDCSEMSELMNRLVQVNNERKSLINQIMEI